MSSREQLRERDFEKKRGSGSGSGHNTGGGHGSVGGSSSVHSGGRTDPFLAETAIREEPGAPSDYPVGDRDMDHRAIPTRESSLRTSGSHRNRTSARRSKRESDGPLRDAILEAEEFVRSHEAAMRSHARSGSDTGVSISNKSFLLGPGEYSSSGKGTAASSPQFRETDRFEYNHLVSRLQDLDEEGAPFPAVSQGRRREESSLDIEHRNPSGRLSPALSGTLRPKRSSSRLKRLSGPLTPRAENRTRESSREPSHNIMPAGYERPVSADSVDDAVESYLCSPRLSQKIKHPQTGRVISFSEVGDADGSAVFCCVGMGLTRYITAFYDELALTLKLRLITPDRPGVGDSEPYTDGTTTPLSWPGRLL